MGYFKAPQKLKSLTGGGNTYLLAGVRIVDSEDKAGLKLLHLQIPGNEVNRPYGLSLYFYMNQAIDSVPNVEGILKSWIAAAEEGLEIDLTLTPPPPLPPKDVEKEVKWITMPWATITMPPDLKEETPIEYYEEVKKILMPEDIKIDNPKVDSSMFVTNEEEYDLENTEYEEESDDAESDDAEPKFTMIIKHSIDNDNSFNSFLEFLKKKGE